MEDPVAIIRELAISESGRASAPAALGSALPALAVFAVALCIAFPQFVAADGPPYYCHYCWYWTDGYKSTSACVVNETYCPGAAHYYAQIGNWQGEGSGCWGPYNACFYNACGQCADWPDSP